MSVTRLYDEGIKYLHLTAADSGNPLYTQSEPMHLISVILNTTTGFEIMSLYNNPTVDEAKKITQILVSSAPDGEILFDIPLKDGFTISRAVASNDVTIVYKGPTIVL